MREVAMDGTRDVLISDLRVDGGTQARVSIDQDAVDDYAASLDRGIKLPPSVAFFDGESNWLADGFHRRAAHIKADLKHMTCDVRRGTQRDAILFSVGTNADHGLRRTNADKQRAVVTLLNDSEWQTWSNRKIADTVSLAESTVRRYRDELGQEQPTTRQYTTCTGKTATMNTANIGRAASSTPDLSSDESSHEDVEPDPDPPFAGTLPVPFDDEPSASFDQRVKAEIAALRAVRVRLGRLFAYDSKAKRFNNECAQGLSFPDTLGAIDQLVRVLQDGAAKQIERREECLAA